ncbi:DUF4492 domain-containing protein [uncultured Bacteroides sp.]|uniref:DUF4492 domain-containing protein n=1 Tax=uncultured Bacteroides sp. TaxID=162156 RepID=UPI00280A8201|nr:DUF4492 domain-containing protein [uncultured Bacteroides sp.]
MIKNTIIRIFHFYRDGFREMTIGRTLWAIILIKLFVMFFILKLFFFPSFRSGKSETEKQDYVGVELTDRMAE